MLDITNKFYTKWSSLLPKIKNLDFRHSNLSENRSCLHPDFSAFWFSDVRISAFHRSYYIKSRRCWKFVLIVTAASNLTESFIAFSFTEIFYTFKSNIVLCKLWIRRNTLYRFLNMAFFFKQNPWGTSRNFLDLRPPYHAKMTFVLAHIYTVFFTKRGYHLPPPIFVMSFMNT